MRTVLPFLPIDKIVLCSSVVESGENKTEANVSQYAVVYACIIMAVFFREHVKIAFLCIFCNVSIINVRQYPTSNRPVILCLCSVHSV